jgi:hypothetical protein
LFIVSLSVTTAAMAIAVQNPTPQQDLEIPDVKVKTIVNHVEVEVTPKPPVADNFMYDFQHNHELPTIGRFGVIDIPTDYDAQAEADTIVIKLGQTMGAGDAEGFADLFLDFGTTSQASQKPD